MGLEADLERLAVDDYFYVDELVKRWVVKGAKPEPIELPKEWEAARRVRVFEALCGLGFKASRSESYRFRAPGKSSLLVPIAAACEKVRPSMSQKAKDSTAVVSTSENADNSSIDDIEVMMSGMALSNNNPFSESSNKRKQKESRAPAAVLTTPQRTPTKAKSSAVRAVQATTPRAAALMSPAQRRISTLVVDKGTPGKGATKAQAVMIGNGYAIENLDGASTLNIDVDVVNQLLLLEFDEDTSADEFSVVGGARLARRRVVLPFEPIKYAAKTLGAEMVVKFESVDDVLCYTFNSAWGQWSMCVEGEPFFDRVVQALSLETSFRLQFCKPESMSSRLQKLQESMEQVRAQRASQGINGKSTQAVDGADGGTVDFYQKYRLGSTSLGSGAFAEVFVATHIARKERYAAKVMNTRKINAKTQAGIVQEYKRAKAASDNPYVASMYAMYGSLEEGKLILVQELCVGGELFDRIIDTEGMPEEDCKIVMRQLLNAVAYLHKLGTVHRDLKPENVMFKTKKNLDIRLIDFGIGRSLNNSNAESDDGKLAWRERLRNRISMQSTHSPSTHHACTKRHMTLEAAQTICGTHEYMAPEVWEATDGCGYGTSCDIWSCGVILFAMLSMAPAFYGANSAEIRQAVLKGSVDFEVWPFAGRKGERLVGPLVRPIIELMLTADPEKRPTATQLLENKWFQ